MSAMMHADAPAEPHTGRALFRLLAAGVLFWLGSGCAVIVWFFSTTSDPGLLAVAMPFYAWFMAYTPGGILMVLYGAVQALRRRVTVRTVIYAAAVYFLPVTAAIASFYLFALLQPVSVQEGDLPMMYSAFGGPLFFLLYVVGLVLGFQRRDQPVRQTVLAIVVPPLAGVVVQGVLLAGVMFTSPYWEHRHALALAVERIEWRDPGLVVEATLSAREEHRAVMHAFYRYRRGEGGGGEPVERLEFEGRTYTGQAWVSTPVSLAPGGRYRLRMVWDRLRTTSLDGSREVILRFVAGANYHSGELIREFRIAADPDAPTLAALDSKLSPVSRGGKMGYANRTGKIVIEPRFDFADAFSEGLAVVRVGTKWGYVEPSGNLAIPLRYDEATRFSEGLAGVLEGRRAGYVDRHGKPVIPFQFDYAHPFSEGRARVRLGGKEGFIDRTGHLVVAPQWEWVTDFVNGFAGVKIGNRWGFIDPGGALVIEPQFEAIQCCSEGRANVMRERQWGYIDAAGRFVTGDRR
jgi:hypothetical protein